MHYLFYLKFNRLFPVCCFIVAIIWYLHFLLLQISVEEPAKLSDIIKNHKYPIMIQFARHYSEMRVSGTRENTKSFASLLLVKEYEENFLCCHYLENGKYISQNVYCMQGNFRCSNIFAMFAFIHSVMQVLLFREFNTTRIKCLQLKREINTAGIQSYTSITSVTSIKGETCLYYFPFCEIDM